MRSACVVDANILVYAYDRSEIKKQVKARDVLDWLHSSQLGFLSTQVLGEFYNAVTRNVAAPLTRAEASAEVEKHLRVWRVLIVTPAIVLEAARGSATHQLAYWDSQIWATAKLNQIPVVLTEDFQHERRIEGVRFFNPFLGDFPGEE